MSEVIDSYSETNQDTDIGLGDNHPSDTVRSSAAGQSFTMLTADRILTSCKFYLQRLGSPTGTGYARLYAHSGTYGTSSLPTGSPLASSEGLDVSTVSTSYTLYEFLFTGVNQYQMVANTYYVIVFEEPEVGTIDASNRLNAGRDGSSPSHSGNRVIYNNGAWVASDVQDVIFYVYGNPLGQPYISRVQQVAGMRPW